MTTLDSIDQIQKLANFIMAEVPGEPSQSEGAVDCAIRWMRSALAASPQPANPAQVTDAMPSYGTVDFLELGKDVNEATTGQRSDFNFGDGYPGHTMLPALNFNSLNRIVSKYLTAAIGAGSEEGTDWHKAFAAQSRKLQAVLHIPGVKEAIAELKWSEPSDAIGAGGQAVAQFLPTEDGEFNGNATVADIVPEGCTGRALVFDPGVLHVNKDGSGYIVVGEEAWQLEDDRCEGVDGPEGSVHWITRLDASEMQALRDFLNGVSQPHPADERVVEALRPFAAMADFWDENEPDSTIVDHHDDECSITLGDCRAAREALSAKEAQ